MSHDVRNPPARDRVRVRLGEREIGGGSEQRGGGGSCGCATMVHHRADYVVISSRGAVDCRHGVGWGGGSQPPARKIKIDYGMTMTRTLMRSRPLVKHDPVAAEEARRRLPVEDAARRVPRRPDRQRAALPAGPS